VRYAYVLCECDRSFSLELFYFFTFYIKMTICNRAARLTACHRPFEFCVCSYTSFSAATTFSYFQRSFFLLYKIVKISILPSIPLALGHFFLLSFSFCQTEERDHILCLCVRSIHSIFCSLANPIYTAAK
jgi:hypothetical protein